ncbi:MULTISPECIES: helix-turn-helix domain-containing protein [Aneurinibacillus]|uniref:Transcriptional regulator n=1 Tax=Aneurinibacillus migulanus TaxID=47500 RepID=A0A0D1VAW3_ANEMI|nr:MULTISPECIES: helix-turn-helix transcriptional regulator [Aneurinibacillus]KIV56559.1 transcriptional regulator [Aneurinibacillus migulanus]KON95318.1 transcriptional regulator [Aneurinibacillus migulanus]MED0893736.1 helix-turn-helix transcriptional regulator [Aneurinibacillus migulanus]MED1617760.1 helix-turn-helix transcriptional regulator [Aneurinibacillus migulanus]WCN36405.1 helix-turn-helix transcriptional regulator [Aneurinibacillus sp. B1]
MAVYIKLRQILEQKGISQRELARMTGLRASTINHLCSEKVDRVYLETLELICKTLNIRIEDLIEIE